MTPEPASLEITGGRPTPVLSGPDPETGAERIRVYGADVESDMYLHEDGSVELSVEGAVGVGKKEAEKRVMRTLRLRLREEGQTVSFEPGEDDRGEDGKLLLDNDCYTFQVVTAPSVREYWREANTDSATTHVPAAHAAEWLGQAVSSKARKTSPAELPKTVLAIDAQHAGLLASEKVLSNFSSAYGDPSVEPGFASVWVVGPTTDRCARIGGGTP